MTDVRTSLLPFYMTFPVSVSRDPSDIYGTETHAYWPKGADGKGWVRIMARTYDQAMTLAHAYFGNRYAFLYPADKFDTDEDRRFYPLGELAIIELGTIPAPDADGPHPIVTTSESELYGVAGNTTICARIEGELIGVPNAEANDVELVHRTCLERGKALFVHLYNVDTNVMAYELDWAEPIECPVCGTNIIR